MNDDIKLSYTVPGDDFTRAGEASAHCKATLKKLGVDSHSLKGYNTIMKSHLTMAAAIAATVAEAPVTILGADCVKKSYPAFWQDFRTLGGCYEQYLR